MTLAYYALYKRSTADPAPTGIVILEPTTSDALLWNPGEEAWTYDPEAANRILFNRRNWDRFRPLNRAEAEQITPTITGADELPDEETIRYLFQWKGQPPDLDPE